MRRVALHLVAATMLLACAREQPCDELGLQEAVVRELLSTCEHARKVIFLSVDGTTDPPAALIARLGDLGVDVLPLSAARPAPVDRDKMGRELATPAGGVVDTRGRPGAKMAPSVKRRIGTSRAVVYAWGRSRHGAGEAVFVQRRGRWRLEKQLWRTYTWLPDCGMQPPLARG